MEDTGTNRRNDDFSDRWVKVCLPLLFAVLFAGVAWQCVDWNMTHNAGTGWDEPGYFNQVHTDVWAWRRDGLPGLLHSFVADGRKRPPAYRVPASVVGAIGGPSNQSYRYVSMAAFLVTLGFLFAAGKRLGGVSAGWLVVLMAVVAPGLIAPTRRFGTEYPLFIALAGSLFFLACILTAARQRWWMWVGLGFVIGLGGLSKPNYFAVFAPLLLMVGLWAVIGRVTKEQLFSIGKAAAISALIFAPWWAINGGQAIVKVASSAQFERHNLGPLSWATTAWWFQLIVLTTTGMAIATLIILLAGDDVIRGRGLSRNPRDLTVKTEERPDSNAQPGISLRTIGWMMLLAGVPWIVVNFFGVNHNTRLVAPALLTIFLGAATLAARNGWLSGIARPSIVMVLVVIQGALLIVPPPSVRAWDKKLHFVNELTAEVFEHQPQNDYEPLRQYCDLAGIESPEVRLFGHTPNFNPPQVENAWRIRGEAVNAYMFWRYEWGDVDWAGIEQRLDAVDIVAAVIRYHGPTEGGFDKDNAHDAQFLELMETRSDFQRAITLDQDQCDIAIFVSTDVYTRAVDAGLPVELMGHTTMGDHPTMVSPTEED